MDGQIALALKTSARLKPGSHVARALPRISSFSTVNSGGRQLQKKLIIPHRTHANSCKRSIRARSYRRGDLYFDLQTILISPIILSRPWSSRSATPSARDDGEGARASGEQSSGDRSSPQLLFPLHPPFICNYLQNNNNNDIRSSVAKRHRNPRTRICKGMSLSQTNSARFGDLFVNLQMAFFVVCLFACSEPSTRIAQMFLLDVKCLFANKTMQSNVARCGAVWICKRAAEHGNVSKRVCAKGEKEKKSQEQRVVNLGAF